MKVLHVEAGMHLYGGALQVVFLLQGLRRPGDEHVLACPSGSAIAGAALPHATRVHEIAMKGDADIGLVARLRRLIREEQPDVVHLHSRRGSDVWGGLAARLEGVPAVLSRRVDNPEPRAWVKYKYRLYTKVVAISHGIREVLLAQGVPADKVVCVHSSVDTGRYRPGCRDAQWFRREFSLHESDPVLAMVAQFIPRKGHRTLLDAMPAILAAHPRTRVLLFGQGPEQEAVREQIAARGLQGNVALAGFRNDLDQVLPCVDVVVHPASMEGLGVALLQSAACGVPMVAARAGGIPEVVIHERTGILIEPGDAHALANGVNDLLHSDELRRRYGQAGRVLVLDEFSVDAMVRGNRRVYEEVCASA